MGGFGRHSYLDIVSQSLRTPRAAEFGTLGRLRRVTGRGSRAEAVEERGSDTRATRRRRRRQGRVETAMGEFGPPDCIDIVSRSLRPPRYAESGALGRLGRIAGRRVAGTRHTRHELHVVRHKDQSRLIGLCGARRSASQDTHTTGQL